jgi:hypothetical protein
MVKPNFGEGQPRERSIRVTKLPMDEKGSQRESDPLTFWIAATFSEIVARPKLLGHTEGLGARPDPAEVLSSD